MLKCYRAVEYYVPLHHAMVSKEIKFYCGNEKPLYMTYKSHTMIFQQNFQAFKWIYTWEGPSFSGVVVLLQA